MTTWIEIPPHSDFSIHNLPFGIFSYSDKKPRVGVAIGEYIIDMKLLAATGALKYTGVDKEVLSQPMLNPFIALGRPVWKAVRTTLQAQLHDPESMLRKKAKKILVPMAEAQMHLPVHVPNYTDFYSSEEHATNVGSMFRGPENALMPNWKHLPVAYHGRASSIVVSGTPLHRPQGQTRPNDAEPPVFGPSKAMDFELEVAFIVGKENELGQAVSTTEAEEHIFGFVLFNDWSARDIQKWEYVPLGPFLGKNFGSSVSAWVVTLDALEPFRTSGPVQEPEVLPYLKTEGEHSFDIALEVAIQPRDSAESIVCRSNFKYMYWNICQQLAHHTVNGCNLQIGDMLASGTISGKTPDSYGSMLELTWGGKIPLTMSDGSQRKYLHDYDRVATRGFAEKEGIRVGFGEVSGVILPAKS